MISPFALPPLETGEHSFVSGWLSTTRDVMLAPGRFFSRITQGPVALPLRFALLSLAPPLLLNEAHAYVTGSTTLGALTLLRTLLAPVIAVAVLVYLQALLWAAVCRLFGAHVPLSLPLRAFAYLTALASTVGLAMTIAGFAPESGPCVVFWYLALNGALLFATYATYKLARGPYNFGPIKSLFVVSLFQLACALTAVATLALYVAAGGTHSDTTDLTDPETELENRQPNE